MESVSLMGEGELLFRLIVSFIRFAFSFRRRVFVEFLEVVVMRMLYVRWDRNRKDIFLVFVCIIIGSWIFINMFLL